MLFTSASYSQLKKTFPRDTSYTLKSALEKVQRKYPFAKLISTSDDLEIIKQKSLVYADYDGRSLHLDLFLSKSNKSKRKPLVVLIHGGGWASGDRSMLFPLAQQLAENGFASAAIEYRLSPEKQYPAAVSDIITSIKWLKYNSVKYNLDSNKVALLGTSAGGHLAVYAGVIQQTGKYLTLDSLSNLSGKVNALIDIDGVLDLTDPAESGKDTNAAKPSVLKRWFGYSYEENPKLWQDVSPINHVTKDTPPILFINSSIPRFHAGRDVMIEEMNEFAIYSEVHTIENSPHSFWLFDPWFERTKNYVIDFLSKIFLKKDKVE